MSYRDWEMRWHAFVLITATVLITLAIVFGVRDCNEKKACEDRGGTVEKYDCSTSYITQSCGKDCYYTSPITSCKWRCVGGKH